MTETRTRRQSLQLANIKNGEAILEVAPGTGITFREILKANPDGRNVGVDITPAMLEKGRLKAAHTVLSNYQSMSLS